jgi:hypothetical protein
MIFLLNRKTQIFRCRVAEKVSRVCFTIINYSFGKIVETKVSLNELPVLKVSPYPANV